MRIANRTERARRGSCGTSRGRGRTVYCSGCDEPARTDPHPEYADALAAVDEEINELKEGK